MFSFYSRSRSDRNRECLRSLDTSIWRRSLRFCVTALFTAASALAQQTVVANYSSNSLVVLDLATGDRTILSDASTGTGTMFQSPVGVAREADGSILVAENTPDARIFRIDPVTGNRTVISHSTVGSGPTLQYVYGLAVSSDGTIYASNYGGSSVVAVNPSTGDRTVLGSSTVGSGAPLGGCWGIAVEPDGNLLVAQYSAGTLVRINVSTLVRTVVSSSSVGTGPAFANPTGIVRLNDGSVLVVNISSSNYLIRVDTVTGQRTVVTGGTVGSGPTVGYRYSVSIDTAGNYYLSDFQASAILRVDATTGARTTIASNTLGTGPALSSPLGMLGGAVASISNPTTAPTISSATTASGTYGSSFSYTIVADQSPTSYAATGLPAGLAIDTASGEISGTPTTTGTFAVDLTATNAGGSGSATLTVTIAARPLTVTAQAGQTKTYGAADPVFSYTITSGTLYGSDSLSGALSRAAGEAVGDYALQAGTLSAGSHYTLTFVPADFSITRGTASITLGALAATYDGTAKSVSVSTTPSGLATSITYDGAAAAPIAAGSYAVVATIQDANYTGTASGTLQIAPASQTITLAPITGATVGQTLALTASASSGLPVTFTVVSGPATLSGSTLTFTGTDPVTFRASQAGNANYLAVSVEDVISQIGKSAQSISFASVADQSANAQPFNLTATATSGLPVSFTVVQGPAVLNGAELTLTGAPGQVVVRAEQAGNAEHAAAPAVTHSFTVHAVGPMVYFGAFGPDQARVDFAVEISQDQRSATLIGRLPGTGEAFVTHFAIAENGTWETIVTPLTSGLDTAAADAPHAARAWIGGRSAASVITGRAVPAPAGSARTFRGSVQHGVLTGTLVETNLAFSAQMEPPTGPTAPLAGYYEATSLDSAAGATYSVVGTQGTLYVLGLTAHTTLASAGQVAPDGSFNVATDAGNMLGHVDAASTAVTGQIVLPSGSTERFSGVRESTLRTDRLINLSTRARFTGSGGEGTLIAGFVVGGESSKQVLLRGVGPALSPLGVQAALADPRLRLVNAQGETIAENDNWGGTATLAQAMQRVGAFPLPADSKDAALLVDLPPGAYTLHVLDGGQSGIALAEIYDAAVNPAGEYQRLINISSRGHVAAGEGLLIGGFVVNGNAPKRVLVRGSGPALAAHGLQQVLPDPVIRLYNDAHELIATNNDWATPTIVQPQQVAASASEIAAASQQVGAFAFDAASQDAAVLLVLAPGSYTVHLHDAGTATGVGLIEVYEVP